MRPSTKPRLFLTAAVSFCAVVVSGCANLQFPAVDPSGQRLFAQGPIELRLEPGPVLPRHDAGIILTPIHVIAPVGSEVILLAGVCGGNGHLVAGERVEWMIAPGEVGQFVTVGKEDTFGRFFRRDNSPGKVHNTYAVGCTSRAGKVLTRGTPCAADDVPVLRGQAWISVTSPVEGTSHVTALGPDVYSWDNRKQTATIHWVDAEWSLPPPAVNPVGTRHVFTTTVMRHSDHSPVSGWRVRYEITDGPPAGFAPDGSPTIEVSTDALGQASVEILQPQPTPGTNIVSIEIIRGSGGERLVVGSGTTSKTWTSPQLALRKTGPSQASVGATIVYQLELSNPGDIAARDVVLRETPGAGLTFLRSSPEPSPGTGTLEWRIGDLAPGQVTNIQAEFRADRPGMIENCASATAADGLTAKDCAMATVLDRAALDVSMVGPQRADVGQDVTFEITVTNRGDTAATGLLLVDRFDEGLEHASAARPIERDLDDLAPGQSRRIGVTLRATQTGRLCNRVEVRGEGDIRAQAEACIEAVQPEQRPSLTVTKSGPTLQRVGDVAQFVIDVTNTGTEAITSLRVIDNYDLALEPVEATEGYTTEGDDLVWLVTRLDPGQTVTRRINCRCREPAAQACNRVTVTAGPGVSAEDEACLEIQAAAPGAAQAPRLTVEVADLRDPVQAGRDVVYVIRVANVSRTTASAVRVTAHVPTGMTPLDDGTSGPTPFEVDGQTIRFEPVDYLDPGQTVAYEVHVRAGQPGNVLFRVEVSSEGLAEPIIREHGTTVFAGP